MPLWALTAYERPFWERNGAWVDPANTRPKELRRGENGLMLWDSIKRGDLKRIAYATHGELTADDLSSEAWLLAIEIEEKLERPFDFGCKLDQDRLLAWMYARFVRFADKAVRHAVRLDKGWDDEAEEGLGSRIARLLLAPEHSDPHRQHGALDEAAELRAEVQKSYSEAAAYAILLIRTEWDLPALAEDLLTGVQTVRARIGRAVRRLEVQLGLFDAVDRLDWEFSPRRKRRIQRRSSSPDASQLALVSADD